MDLAEYLVSRGGQVEGALNEFIKSHYRSGIMEMAAYAVTGGKRVRGIMSILVCEALGGTVEQAKTAACAVELCQAASLAKDDIQDNDEMRRGKPSFWKQYGMQLAVLVPDMLIPHATLFTQQYGPRALGTVIAAWGNVTRGQLLDFPSFRRLFPLAAEDYASIIALKTAPLFSAAAELGCRASKKEWFLEVSKTYGHETGMAFQCYDDACDLIGAIGQPWEAVAKGPLPVSIQALKFLVDGGDRVSEKDALTTMYLGAEHLKKAQEAADTFPMSNVKDLLIELPQWGCRSLLIEAFGQEKVNEGGLPGI